MSSVHRCETEAGPASHAAVAALAAADADRHGAFVTVTTAIARADAAAADAATADRIARRGALHAVPVALKDVIDVADVPTCAGPAGVGRRVPQRDAAVVRALREAGAIVIGKTTLPDLALGVLTPGCTNPRDPGRVSGGSSGGSAAAVAAGVVTAALGTDTGGSVRIPAALTGVVGLRPTHGAFSFDGVSVLSPSQDTVGILAATASDCRRLLRVLRPMAGLRPVPREIGCLEIAVPDGLWRDRVSSCVGTGFERGCARLSEYGHRVRTCALPAAAAAPAVSYVILAAEASGIWADTDALPDEVREHLAFGRRISSSERGRTTALAQHIRGEVLALFAGGVDVVALPTTAATAAPVGATHVVCGGRAEPLADAYCRFTALASVAGLPAISVPCATDASGLPIGLQLIGPPRSELLLVRLAELVDG